MEATVEVRIRHVSETASEGRKLCHWPATELDQVIPMLSRWGIRTEGGYSRDYDLLAEFVVGSTTAYFEVLYMEVDPA